MREVAVVGKPDERAGEVPVAVVVKAMDKVNEEQLVKLIEDKLSIQKRLYGGVKFVESLPKTESGKILRRKVREMLV